MRHIEETLNFIESDEMLNYLRSLKKHNSDEPYLTRSICAEIVSKAPASLERKISVLGLIAKETKRDAHCKRRDPIRLADYARDAITEQQHSQPGDVFQVRELIYHETANFNEYSLFYGFNAAMKFIKDDIADFGSADSEIHNSANYLIEKYVQGDNGVMINTYHWVVNSSGEIWYCNYKDENNPVEHDEYFYDYWGTLNLPIPFKPGDIVTADCRPFAKEKRVLIICIGDNYDCCSVQCVFIGHDKILHIGALKHNSFFCKNEERSPVSALYRLARYTGELDESEHPLGIISAAIKTNPQLAKDIHDCFFDSSLEYVGSYDGVKWNDLKNKFSL